MVDRRSVLRSAMAAACTYAVGAVAAPRKKRPNFIIIYCDDLGYGDVGPTAGRSVPTPNLDRMAQQGLVLTDYYAPANVCTPSRAGLLTGRYPIRTGLTKALLAQDSDVLPTAEVTIAEALRPTYRSALIGKWHLGHTGADWSPTKHGFDLFYGIPYSHDISPLKVMEHDQSGAKGEWEPDFPRLQQQFYARAERFIEEHRDRPFFLELALSSPHLPNYPAPGFEKTSQLAGAYGDTIVEIDAIVGRMLAKLAALEIDDNTLLIFTSDNGPWFEGSTGGLRQRKGGAGYDGAYRVPFIARWPDRIPAGTRSDAIAMGIDLLPTFCALGDIAPPKNVELDGKDISALLTRQGASPHEELLLFQGKDVVGIRTQQWKYVNADFYMSYFVLLEKRGYPQLYDMRDPSEQYSVASLHPDVLREMRARLARAAERFASFKGPADSPLDAQRKAPPPHDIPRQWSD